MKQLSIIIVNYNVRHFLEQALLSVQRAIATLDAEVFVVDNNSVDGSVAMLYDKFPWVKVIANKKNLGFSKGNNLAIRQAQGKYILLLNPDTVVEEDTFTKIIEFMDATPDAGALGVKMYNGEGKFLPESKRALPTPWVAFYKIFGLSRLFPKSKKFGKYHLTYLNPDEIHQIEVLSGAFMFMRKSVLDEIGYLDEDFFMYGEDIDLSYRVTKAGYHNYYYPHTKIIHYKGESTRKGSLNYVLVFYDAMRIFAEKHFGDGGNYNFYLSLIRLAIYLRAGVSIVRRLTEKMIFPVLEGGLFLGATLGIKELWENLVKYPDGEGYSQIFDWFVAPIYSVIFVFYLYVMGAYKRPFKIRSVFTAIFSGFITIATLNFIFKDINFSRAIVLMASGAILLLSLFIRALHNYIRSGNFFLDEKARKRVVIVGDYTEAERVIHLIDYQLFYNCNVVGVITNQPMPAVPASSPFPVLGDSAQTEEIVRFYQIDEIVFCNKSLPTQDIIEQMSRMAERNVEFKIVPNSADYLIGPSVILNASGVQPKLSNLQKQEYRFRKKLFDFVVSIGLITTYPLTFWMYRKPIGAFKNLWQVLNGNYHLVGYIDGSQPDLPKLKESLLNMKALAERKRKRKFFSPEEAIRLDHVYARYYTTMLDLEIVLSGFRNLGERT